MNKDLIRILLIEDNPGDARLLRETLAEFGGAPFELHWVARLSEGLERLDEGGIDLVLLDLSLPDSHGLETLFKVRDREPNVPVVVLTGTDDEVTGALAVRRGAQDYLVKGRTDGDLLPRAVNYAIARSQLEGQLRQAQKMEAVGRLAGGVAHDFNNMLTGILGQSELLLRKLTADAPERRRVGEIVKAGERAATLTRQLLAFSRKQILQPRVLDLNSVVSDAQDALARLVGDDISLRFVPGAGLWAVKSDPGQIESVLMNLAANARDAMTAGGSLTVETANVQLSEAYACMHVPVEPGPYVMLAVSDTGAGMDAETQRRIFEPFFTTKGQGAGTGLGLSTVYGVVKQSGGYIWVYSEPGLGTTFKIYLPRTAEAGVREEPRAAAAGMPRGDETILLAEDEDLVRGMTRDMLEMCGYTVIEAADGVDALSVCERHDGPVHLLLTDVVMPRMGGRELADRVAAARPETRVLFISGYTDNAIVHRGVLEPGVAFLQKPFTPEALAQRVRGLLDAPRP